MYLLFLHMYVIAHIHMQLSPLSLSLSAPQRDRDMLGWIVRRPEGERVSELESYRGFPTNHTCFFLFFCFFCYRKT